MNLSKLDRYVIDDMGGFINLEHLVRMACPDFYMRQEHKFLLLDKDFKQTGFVLVNNGSLIERTQAMLGKYARKAVPKKQEPKENGYVAPERSTYGNPRNVGMQDELAQVNAINDARAKPDVINGARLYHDDGSVTTAESKVSEPVVKEREYVYVTPDYVQKLFDKLRNTAEAARRIGVSPNVISGALRDGQTRMPNELACRYVFERDFADKPQLDDTARLKEAIAVVRELSKKLGVETRIEDGEIKLRRLVMEEL